MRTTWYKISINKVQHIAEKHLQKKSLSMSCVCVCVCVFLIGIHSMQG